MNLYEKIYPSFGSIVARPVLVIYMQGATQKCLERIHRRNRPYEQKIEPKFMEALNSGYEQFFTDWKSSPVIRISISQFDCTSDDDIKKLAAQIKSYVVI